MITHHLPVISSTNEHLAALAEEGAPHWTVVLADTQTGGKGRAGRSWWSPAGNLYMSVLLRPDLPVERMSRIPILASLAVLTAVRDLGIPVQAKWPNDILLDGKKVAGILSRVRSEGGRAIWVVTGFGVNIRRPAEAVPDEIRDKIGFLGDFQGDVDADALARGVLENFRSLTTNMEGDAWKEAADRWSDFALWGVPYLFRDGARELRGTPLRLADDGGLVMKTRDGTVTVYSGELEESPDSGV
ncbi:MAG: biotin--[acetyl-CoA-carboxylase] ligase [bacterium]|nr:MAG: biotin--[acetyl-CoA-carboxylase] ligase [bacterium]